MRRGWTINVDHKMSVFFFLPFWCCKRIGYCTAIIRWIRSEIIRVYALNFGKLYACIFSPLLTFAADRFGGSRWRKLCKNVTNRKMKIYAHFDQMIQVVFSREKLLKVVRNSELAASIFVFIRNFLSRRF